MRVTAEISYTKLQQIGVGEGLNSEVFLVHDPQLGGKMVAKEIPKAWFPRHQEYFAEAKVMFASASKNVVQVQYGCQTADKVCLVMPHYSNGSLAHRIAKGPLPPREAVHLFLRVLAGVAEVHLAGFLHLDLKPSNILFADDGEPLVADFGQASPIGANGIALIPRMYWFALAPEIFDGVATVETDIYQCGLAAYRAVNGDRFFEEQKPPPNRDALEAVVRAGTFPSRSQFLPHVPKGLRTVIRKALSVNPSRRYPSAHAFIDALGQVNCPHNWVMTDEANVTRWRSERSGRAALEVTRHPDALKWAVEVHQDGGVRRCYQASQLWKKSLTLGQADAHLKNVFHHLSRP